MAKIEKGLGYYLNQEAPKTENESKENKLSTAKKEINNDYVITLDIEGHNRQFREKASGIKIKNFWDNAKALIGSWLKKSPNNQSVLGLENRAAREQSTAEKGVNKFLKQNESLAAIKAQTAEQPTVAPAEKLQAEKPIKQESQKSFSNIAEILDMYHPILDNVQNQALVDAFEQGQPNNEQVQEVTEALENQLKNLQKDPDKNQQQINRIGKALEMLSVQAAEKQGANEKIKTYKHIAELLDIHQPLAEKAANQNLAMAFQTGNPNPEQLEQAAKALDVITLKLSKDSVANSGKIESVTQLKEALGKQAKIIPFRKRNQESSPDTLKQAA